MEMIPEVLIAWIETEGSITLNVHPGRPTNPHITFQTTQKDRACLERMKEELGVGSIAENNFETYVLRFRNKHDLKEIMRIIDSVPESAWYTKKLLKYQEAKKYFKFMENKKDKRWTRNDFEQLLKHRVIISPRARYSDEQLREAFITRLELIEKTQRMWAERKNSILSMKLNGISVKKIAIEFNVHWTTIYKWLKKWS